MPDVANQKTLFKAHQILLDGQRSSNWIQTWEPLYLEVYHETNLCSLIGELKASLLGGHCKMHHPLRLWDRILWDFRLIFNYYNFYIYFTILRCFIRDTTLTFFFRVASFVDSWLSVQYPLRTGYRIHVESTYSIFFWSSNVLNMCKECKTVVPVSMFWRLLIS